MNDHPGYWKEIRRSLIVVLFVNLSVLIGAVIAGLVKGNPGFYFKEREIVTFLSALQLSAASLIASFIFFIRKKTAPSDDSIFWLFCGIGFFYLMCDEWFMIHEGIDDGILGALGFVPLGRHFLFDWMIIAAYGFGALALAVHFRHLILKTRLRAGLFFLAGIFYVVQTGLDAFAGGAWLMIAEESTKLISVSLFYSFFLTVFFESFQEIILPVRSQNPNPVNPMN